MRILVINLDRSPERMAHMAAQLSRLTYERLEGIDGRTLEPAFIRRFFPMRPSEVGCYLSHRAAWQRIADGESQYGIVLEDDLHIAPAFTKFAVSTEWIPPDAGIVKFETANSRVILDRIPRGAWQGSAIHRLRSIHLGTAAYLMSIDVARLLLATRGEPIEPVDHTLFYVDEPWRHLPPAYQLDPAICIQDMLTKSRPKDPRLSSLQEFNPGSGKSLRHSIQRDSRRLYREVARRLATAAANVGLKPPRIEKAVPFAGQ